MEAPYVAVDWILQNLTILIIPALVWVAVIVGLISIVQDKVHREETTLPKPGQASLCGRLCSAHRSDKYSIQTVVRERADWADQVRVFAVPYPSESKEPTISHAIHSEKEFKS